MTEPSKVKIKFALEASALELGRGKSKRWMLSAGAFSAEGSRKPDVVAELETAIAAAVVRTDLGSIVRLGVAGGRVFALHVQHDGKFAVCSAPMVPGGQRPDLYGPEVQIQDNAISIFEDKLEQARAKSQTPDAEASVLRLAERVGVQVAEGEDWQEVAQRVAMAFADAERRGALAERDAEAARACVQLHARGETPEGFALARLLGLRGSHAGKADPAEVRHEAESILAESAGERWSRTLSEVRSREDGWLQTVDRLTGDEAAANAIQDAIDNGEIVRVDHVEEFVINLEQPKGVPDGWTIDGPVDQRIAELIREVNDDDNTDGLYGEARKELDALLEKTRDAVLHQDRDDLDTVCSILEDALTNYGFAERHEVADMKSDALARKIADVLRTTDAGSHGRVTDLCRALRTIGLPDLWVKYRRGRGCRVRRFRGRPSPARELRLGVAAGETIVTDLRLAQVRDELDNRGLLAALPSSVLALLEGNT